MIDTITNIDNITKFIILVMSVVVHEVSHGLAADALGDPTPRLQKRLSLNPIQHIDILGSIIVPFLSIFFGSTVFGWAKPVIINPYNFTRRKVDELIVALAGPFSNFLIALGFALVFHFLGGYQGSSQAVIHLTIMVVTTNIALMIFNLIPIPPLDGSKILFLLIPEKYNHIRGYIDGAGFIVIILFITVISPIVSILVLNLSRLLLSLF